MKIRLAKISDYAPIAGLAGQLGYPSSPETMRVRLLAILNDKDQAIYVAVNEQAAVKGWVHIFKAQRIITDTFAEIGGLIVDTKYQSTGMGRALLGQAEKWADMQGLGIMRIRSNSVREAAHQFYIKMGYRLAKRQNVFIKHTGKTS